MSPGKKQPREIHKGSRVLIIGERIRELRMEKGYSLTQLGMKVNLGKSTLAGYEQGHRFPAIDKLDIIAKVLNTSTDYLLGLTDNKKPKDIRDILENNDELFYNGNLLSTDQIEILNQFLKSFIGDRDNEIKETKRIK